MCGAHPHSRGEHILGLPGYGKSTGSSPLARGPSPRAGLSLKAVRLIPAHAGNALWLLVCRGVCGAHPHSRGNHGAAGYCGSCDGGSSPLARGPYGIRGSRHEKPGLIPAHTGNTAGAVCYRRFVGAHPRTRGENLASAASGLVGMGSFPHTRGRPVTVETSPGSGRLIPARAGTTKLPPLR